MVFAPASCPVTSRVQSPEPSDVVVPTSSPSTSTVIFRSAVAVPVTVKLVPVSVLPEVGDVIDTAVAAWTGAISNS